MPARSNDFQRMIAFLEEQLAPSNGTVQESAMVQPRSGGKTTEVDVLIEAPLGEYTMKVALECQDRSRPATVEWIRTLVGKYSDLPIDRVVAVSRSGFTQEAMAKARREGIDTLTLAEVMKKDWPVQCSRWMCGLFHWHFRLASGRVEYVGEKPELTPDELRSAPVESKDGKVSSVESEILTIYRQDGAAAFNEGVQQNWSYWFPQGPGRLLHPTVRYVAYDKHLIAPDGSRHKIAHIVLVIECYFDLRTPEMQLFEYGRRLVSQGSVTMEDGKAYGITLLHGQQGPEAARVTVTDGSGTSAEAAGTTAVVWKRPADADARGAASGQDQRQPVPSQATKERADGKVNEVGQLATPGRKRRVLLYDDVLRSTTAGPVHLLLGSGFSIACGDRYGYGNLFKSVQRRIAHKNPELGQLMLQRRTHNVEWVMRWLGRAKTPDELGLPKWQVREWQDRVRSVFCEVMIDRHDATSTCITDEEVAHCRRFLDHYGRVFTTNYDLLLSWVMLRSGGKISDGFRHSDEAGDPIFRRGSLGRAKHLYLHGCFYLYEQDGVTRRLRSGDYPSLIEAIEEELRGEGRRPLYVAEGYAKTKMLRIDRNPYLSECLDELKRIGGSLVVFGHRLSVYDKHIREAIAANRNLDRVFVALFDDPDDRSNTDIRRRVLKMAKERKTLTGRPLEVHFFQSKGVPVWRS